MFDRVLRYLPEVVRRVSKVCQGLNCTHARTHARSCKSVICQIPTTFYCTKSKTCLALPEGKGVVSLGFLSVARVLGTLRGRVRARGTARSRVRCNLLSPFSPTLLSLTACAYKYPVLRSSACFVLFCLPYIIKSISAEHVWERWLWPRLDHRIRPSCRRPSASDSDECSRLDLSAFLLNYIRGQEE